jgi:hypothetical protein
MARSNLPSKQLMAAVCDLALELYKSSLMDPRFAAGRPGVFAAALTREHTKYHALCVRACNEPVDDLEFTRRERNIIRRLKVLGYPVSTIRFGGDPRGCVMYLRLPSCPQGNFADDDGYSYRVPRELSPWEEDAEEENDAG